MQEESDQLPEEGPGGQVSEDEQSGSERDDAADQAGGADEGGEEEQGQASGNRGGAG